MDSGHAAKGRSFCLAFFVCQDELLHICRVPDERRPDRIERVAHVASISAPSVWWDVLGSDQAAGNRNVEASVCAPEAPLPTLFWSWTTRPSLDPTALLKGSRSDDRRRGQCVYRDYRTWRLYFKPMACSQRSSRTPRGSGMRSPGTVATGSYASHSLRRFSAQPAASG